MVEVARPDAKAEADVTRMLREQGKCGELGYPLYPDGQRWRTWCTLSLGHESMHGVLPPTIAEWPVRHG